MKDLSWIKTRLIAHRGLHTLDKRVPENTLAAFAAAIDRGYGIEMDINALKDGTVVVFHDKNLQRLCGDSRYLRDLTVDDIRDLRILGTEERISTLAEVLAFVDGRVPLLIELKPFGPYEFLAVNFMKAMNGYQGVWAMHAFNPKAVNWFRMHHPDVIRGQISEFFEKDAGMNKVLKYAMKHLLFNVITKPDFINYGVHDMPNRWCDRAQKRGLTVIGYAARTQEVLDMMRSHYSNAVFEFFIPKP
ncbi:MAG: glycerophosphodiester phosphodiesterase family protein [Bacillota bacterium]|nr:glycerophosphodiester phosphodiesterase family protein [Bacillota bacterium]